MKELSGRLSALDPEASESLKVIAYFDKLIDGRVGAEGMLRGAAVLCGAPVGHQAAGRERGRRFPADGTELPAGPPDGWPSAIAGEGSVVWLERADAPHANDAMVLERLAIALSILSRRIDTLAPTRRAIEVLLAGDATDEQRAEAAARLSLGTNARTHAIAVPDSVALDRALPHAMVGTRFGIVRAVLAPHDDAPAPRAGIGIAARTTGDLRESWHSALIALRLTDDTRPIVRAADLGALLSLAETEDQRATAHPDATAIENLATGPWTVRMLRALVEGASQRALAAEAGVHHSTMGARLQKLPEALGYDPSTSAGRTRLDVALMLHRLANVRFGDEA